MNATIHFDSAWTAALNCARQQAETGHDVVLVRDLLGRVTLVVDDQTVPQGVGEVDWAQVRETFVQQVGAFSGLDPLQFTSAMFAPEALLQSVDLLTLHERTDQGEGRLAILDRTVVGSDWLRPVAEDSTALNRRVTLYGFKGGVGRSTATAVLARFLAEERGLCVLVIDLDLESPGVSSLLADPERLPDHGVVDHLVEDGLGNAAGLELVTRSNLLSVSGNGELWLAPAGGRPREGYDFLGKLNRIYSDLPATEPAGAPRTFARRLEAAVAACEAQVGERSRRPDVVLLDSRAGIHDVAAVAITQLSGLALLFTVDNPATWAGYKMLFQQWSQSPRRAADLRERLRVVAAMLPQATAAERLPQLREHAQEAFSVLYDDEQHADPSAFNPPLEALEAPHSPIPIIFSSDLIGLNARTNPAWPELPLVKAAYESFLVTVLRLLPPAIEEAS